MACSYSAFQRSLCSTPSTLGTLGTWGSTDKIKVDVDSKENRGRYVTKYFEKGIGQELLENFGKQAYLSSRNLKKPDEDKFYTYEDFNYDSSVVLYETEYTSKVYKDGQYFDNHVKYKKIKLDE
mgnify:CR=1 FL=1